MRKLIPWLILSSLIVLLFGCASTERQESTQLRDAIVENLAQDGTVDLESLMPTGWSSLVIVTPYSDLDRRGSDLDFRVPKTARKVSIDLRDDICLLFLLEGATVAEWMTMPSQLADFTTVSSKGRIAASQAKFAIKADESGWPFVVWMKDGFEQGDD